MTDLVEFIEARLTEDEQAGRAAKPGPWRWAATWQFKQVLLDALDDVVIPAASPDAYPSLHNAAHMARHDPARVLREVEAKRALLAVAVEQAGAGRAGVLDPPWIFRVLAAPWSDHPDYRQEWAP